MKKLLLLILIFAVVSSITGCSYQEVQSVSGTKMKAAGKVNKNKNGRTVEQQNIYDRIQMDNKVGAIKHLYIISAYSGQVLIYSTVKGKVTSSGKRLTPDKVDGSSDSGSSFIFKIGDSNYYTDQVLGEDGTYGSSIEYLYWWDSKGIYHQQYITGGMILHISDQPIATKSIVLNMELKQNK